MKACKGLSHASTTFPGVSPFVAALLLSALILLIYSDSLDCSWQFDDITNITNNRFLHIEDLSLQNLERTLLADPGRPGHLYRPVACLTFGLNYYFGGLHVLGYHLVNIVVHILCSILLFLFLHHTLNSFSFGCRYASRSSLIALTAALMWAVHPIQVQSVTYIVQRMTSLAGLFYLLSMYFYAKGRTTRRYGLKVTRFLSFRRRNLPLSGIISGRSSSFSLGFFFLACCTFIAGEGAPLLFFRGMKAGLFRFQRGCSLNPGFSYSMFPF